MRARALKVYITNGGTGFPIANAVYVKPGVAITNNHVCDKAVLLDVKSEDPEGFGASWAPITNKVMAVTERKLDACFLYFSVTALPELEPLGELPLGEIDVGLPLYKSGFTYNSKISFTYPSAFGYALVRGFIQSLSPEATILDFDVIEGESGSGVYQVINNQIVLVSLIRAKVIQTGKGMMLDNNRFIKFYQETLK